MGLNTLKAYAASQQLAHGLKYDYSQIEDADDRAAVMDAALEIKPRLRRTAEDIVAIGNALIAVKDLLPHGQFMPWIEVEFGLPYRTARRFMVVAERLGHKVDNLSDLTASVLYELAADSTPDDVIAQVESRVAAGQTVTVADVRNRIRRSMRRMLTLEETAAVVGRYLERRCADDGARLAVVDGLTVDDLAPAIQDGVIVGDGYLTAAIDMVRRQLQTRLAKAEAERPAPPARSNQAINVERQERHQMQQHLRAALAHLPEAKEDAYYDLTGNTHYSDARNALLRALASLERTVEG